MNKKRILITGATGFVMRNYVLRWIRTRPHTELTLALRSPEKFEEQLRLEHIHQIPEGIRLLKAAAPEWNLRGEKFDQVIHAAGVISAPSLEAFHKVNVEGTMALVEQVGNIPMVIVSSAAAAGPTPAGQEFRLDGQLSEPITHYGVSKYAMEKALAERFASHEKMWILRPPMVLGPRDEVSLILFKMGQRPAQVKIGKNAKFYSFISVDDLVSAIDAALISEEKSTAKTPYFVASDQRFTDFELIDTVRQIMRGDKLNFGIIQIPDGLVRWLSRRRPFQAIPNLSPGRVEELFAENWAVSSQGFQTKTGWKPTWTLRSTLEAEALWYHRQGQLRNPRQISTPLLQASSPE